MKKTLFVLLLLNVLTLFVACGKSEEAEFADNLIANLGEITRNSGAAIDQAEKAVEALSLEDYEDLENLNILKEARAKYEDIFVSEVEQEIAKIAEAKVETEDVVIHAREVYDNLDKDLQPNVENYQHLLDSEAAIFGEKVGIIESAIDNIGEVTLDSEEAIINAREVYNQYPEIIQTAVGNYDILLAAEEAYAEESRIAKCVKEIEQKIDWIGEVTLNSKDLITTARAAYNAGDAVAQERVSNYSVLTAAEETLQNLRIENFKNLVSDIGKVTVNSLDTILKANDAYKDLSVAERKLLSNEITTLTGAIASYKEAVYNAAVANVWTEYDKVEGITWYYPNALPEYIDIRSYVLPYIGKRDSGYSWIVLRFNYTGNDWIFYEKCTIWIDGKTTTESFKYNDITRDNDYGVVWEYIDIVDGDSYIDMLWEIAESNETIVRFEGDDDIYDLTISEKDKRAIIDMLNLYTCLKEEWEVFE